MKINERGYWENETAEGHGHDDGLARALVEFFTYNGARHIADIGCGDGFYTRYLRDHGLVCYGYDGNPYTSQITNGLCEVKDFTKLQYLDHPDWVLSLEVGEHIPEEYENIFIDNLIFNCSVGMVISWAIEGQGGDGHINNRSNKYIIDKICNKGFWYDDIATYDLRRSVASYPTPCYWFRDTLLVFGVKGK